MSRLDVSPIIELSWLARVDLDDHISMQSLSAVADKLASSIFGDLEGPPALDAKLASLARPGGRKTHLDFLPAGVDEPMGSEMWGSIVRNRQELVCGLTVSLARWQARSQQEAVAYYRSVWEGGGIHYGWLGGYVLGMEGLYLDHQLSLLPRQFGAILTWLHCISRETYGRCISREDLLSAPAKQVTEYPDGSILFQVYDDPLEPTSPEAIAAIVAVSRHVEEGIRRFQARASENEPD